jgi:hypothetical protein
MAKNPDGMTHSYKKLYANKLKPIGILQKEKSNIAEWMT